MNPVGWFEIYVDDMSRAKAFYEAVLQVSLEHLNDEAMKGVEMWAFPASMEEYGASGAIAKMEGVSAGGKVMQPKFAIGQHGFISIAADTEGNMIGFHSMS